MSAVWFVSRAALGGPFPGPAGFSPALLATPTWGWAPQCTDPPNPTICGQWSGPFKLEWNGQEISCTSGPGGNDEVGHATLIPTGVHKGRLLMWTLWDDRAVRSSVCPYKSYIVDPSDWSVIAAPSFDPAFSAIEDGPFCSGHTWILDASGNPKFLVGGGIRHVAGSPATTETYWFDPLDTTGQWWFDGPDELPDQDGTAPLVGSWYPSIITFFDAGLNRFRPMAIGGSTKLAPGCADLFTGWWKMTLQSNPTWSIQTTNDGYLWETYPRAHLLATTTAPYAGYVLTSGHDIACANWDGEPSDNPCNKITASGSPQTHQFGPEPNDARPVGIWNSNNAVLLHTLNPGWTWPMNPPLTTDEMLSRYKLNRVIGTGGAFDGNFSSVAMKHTLEFNGTSWTALADAPRRRAFANFIILPDGSAISIGGQTIQVIGGSVVNHYHREVDRHDPQTNTWSTLAGANMGLSCRFSGSADVNGARAGA